ncbi:hypothetical protein, partial [Actinoplanes sp. NPDC049802]|uniref:hypothetical protein n=1 Tax=Actinoplanes sp. NPDC049802 TaxID=3154742 RepID=UPI0033DA3B88
MRAEVPIARPGGAEPVCGFRVRCEPELHTYWGGVRIAIRLGGAESVCGFRVRCEPELHTYWGGVRIAIRLGGAESV